MTERALEVLEKFFFLLDGFSEVGYWQDVNGSIIFMCKESVILS